MSLTKLKAKETKGKQKTLPKLKTILANPYKNSCSTLPDNDFQQLREFFRELMQNDKTRIVAMRNHIRLGLESCLRAIKNGEISCVLLSPNIKPRFLVNLIARNVEVKDETVPVYVHKTLEQFTQDLFGVRALAMILPVHINLLGDKLESWVLAHRKPAKAKVIKKLKKKTKAKTVREEFCEKMEASTNVSSNCNLQESEQEKSWSGDFLSFSNDNENLELDKVKLQDDKQQLMGRLSTIIKNAKNKAKGTEVGKPTNVETMDADLDRNPDDITTLKCIAEVTSKSDNDDDFLQEYQPLMVHKIRPNPDRKPKKKRKKNNKKHT